MSAMDEYVRQVMEHVPPAAPERARIEIDLRSHVEETVAGEGTLGAAAQRIGAPAEVARGYLADIPLSPASIGNRVLAFLIDVLVGFAVFAVAGLLLSVNLIGFAAAFGGAEGDAVWNGLPIVAVVFTILTVSLLSLLYFPLLEWRFGQTVGKRVLGIHVVGEDGTAIGLGAAIVRRIPFFLEFFWIDAIVALFTERQQRAFDLVARTLVVDVGRAPSVAADSGLPATPGTR